MTVSTSSPPYTTTKARPDPSDVLHTNTFDDTSTTALQMYARQADHLESNELLGKISGKHFYPLR